MDLTGYGYYTAQNAVQIKNLLDRLEFYDGWSFSIIGQAGSSRVLLIRLNTTDSTVPRGSGMTVQVLIDHQFPIPEYPMDDMQIEIWILDNILLVLQHEACEKFKVNGKAIFEPEHGEGSHPYRITRR